MRYTIVIALTALTALGLSACDKPTVVAPPAPIIVSVPGPPGPQGPAGAPAEKGATGATGVQGEQGKSGGDTIIVVPAGEQKR